MTKSDQVTLALVAFFLMVMSIGASVVHAETPRIWLARAMVAECGWKPTNCHAAVAHVLQRRAEAQRVPLVYMIRHYCAGLGERRASKRQQWLRELTDGNKPASWPEASWTRHSRYWLAALGLAGDFLLGEVADPCDDPAPYHFGGLKLASDVARMKGRKLARCGDTGNQGFWRQR